jgi:diacylglycerol kinase family enzyme
LNSQSSIEVICNWRAGGGKAHQRWLNLRQQALANGLKLQALVTEYPGHATELARHLALAGQRRLYVFGGDGTLNEALNGILVADQLLVPEPRLVFLSAGSSCDVEKMFPRRQPLLQRLNSDESYVVDVCRVLCHDANGKPLIRYFLANSSLGVISKSVLAFNQAGAWLNWLKRINIDLAAIWAGLTSILKFGNFEATITLDNAESITASLKNLTVFKCPYFGGGMNYGSKSFFDDGKLHTVSITARGSLRTLALIPALYRGTILAKPGAHYVESGQLRIASTDTSVIVEADGEIIGYPPCQYSVLPQILRLSV